MKAARQWSPKRVFTAVLALQLAVLALLGVMIWRRDSHPVTMEIGPNFWQSFTLEGDGWRQPDDTPVIDETVPMIAGFDTLMSYEDTGLTWGADNEYSGVLALFGPDCRLVTGGYTVTVRFDTEEVQYLTPCVGYGTGTVLDGGENHVKLRPGVRQVSFDIYVMQDVQAFRMNLWYSGHGRTSLGAVTITANSSMQRMLLLALLCLFLLGDAYYLNRERIRSNALIFWGLVSIIAVTSLPLTVSWLGAGHDLAFHLRRIEAAAQGLARFEFPVRMASFINEDAGYVSPIMYCDLFLYFPAALRLIGFPMTWAYKLYVLAVNIATALIGYFCFRPMLKDRKAALLATLLWCTAAYRFSNLYFRSAVGEYTAVAFLPLVLLALLRMYDREDHHTIRQNALLMTIGMSGIAASHILTLEMAALILGIFALVHLRTTFSRRVLLAWLLAGAETVLLSLWFLVPFIDYYLNVPMWVTCYTGADMLMIQHYGVNLAELFDFFRNVFILSERNYRRSLLMSPGMAQMAVVVLGAAVCIQGRKDRRIRRLLTATVLLLLLCSDLFPWDRLAVSPLGSLLCIVQFPWRYESLACLLMAVLGGVLLLHFAKEKPELARKGAALCAAACLLMTMYYTGTYLGEENKYFFPHNAAEMESAHGSGGEYLRALPLENVRFQEDWGVKEEKRGAVEASILSHEGTDMEVQAKVLSDSEATLDFIYSNYPGYQITDDQGRSYAITDSDDLHIRIVLPAGFDGRLTVRYVPPRLWRISELVSLAALLGMVLLHGLKRKGALHS